MMLSSGSIICGLAHEAEGDVSLHLLISSSHVRVGPQRRLRAKELMLLHCGAEEDTGESLDSKEIKPVNPKGNQS